MPGLLFDVDTTLFSVPVASVAEEETAENRVSAQTEHRWESAMLAGQQNLTASVLEPTQKTLVATILAVDDDADFLANLVDILTDFGCEVHAVGSGEAGLALATHRRYDVALLDLKMPRMDGVTLCRRLKEVQPMAKVIIISAFPTDASLDDATSAGASWVLLKPLDCDRLTSLIQGTLDAN